MSASHPPQSPVTGAGSAGGRIYRPWFIQGARVGPDGPCYAVGPASTGYVAMVRSEEKARLIAAAPDLLHTLYGIAGEASGQHADPLQTLAVIEAYARAAILKATGEQAP